LPEVERNGHDSAVAASNGRSEWQRRYDESIARERASIESADDEVSGGEYVAMEASRVLPGVVGVAAAAVTALAMFVRRRHRRA
jgi:hypothetical protein